MEPEVSRHSRRRPPETAVARKRFKEFLAKMAEAGVTQQQLAQRTGVPAQQVCDIKNARRPVTEIVARRFGEQFGVDYYWFLGQDSPKEGGPGFDPMDAMARGLGGKAPEQQQTVQLPVHVEPIDTDPFDPALWGGGLIPVVGPAAVAAQASSRPYVLRVLEDDCRGRLKRGDMVLVLQQPNRTDVGNIGVIRSGGSLLLARRAKEEEWRTLVGDKQVACDANIAQCAGVVWGSLESSRPSRRDGAIGGAVQ